MPPPPCGRGACLVLIAALQVISSTEYTDAERGSYVNPDSERPGGLVGQAGKMSEEQSQRGGVEVTLKYSYANKTLFNYAAESRGYPEEPDRVFVTCRGGGMTVIDISTGGESESAPDIIARWDVPWTVEGQDRMGELLVVSELGRGPDGALERGPHLHLFRLPEDGNYGGLLSPFASMNLTSRIDAILHVKLYQHTGGDLWALCTGGFATSAQGAVVAVNLTGAAAGLSYFENGGDGNDDSSSSREDIFVLETNVTQPEGIMIVGDFAYIGGISSKALAVVALAEPNPSHMHIVTMLYLENGVMMCFIWSGAQLVATSWPKEPFGMGPADILYMADWRDVGGLAVVNVSDPKAPILLSSVRSLRAAKANRVKLLRLRPESSSSDKEVQVALLPLEQPIGALAVVDVTDPAEARLLAVRHLPLHLRDWTSTKTYCLAVNQRAEVHVFTALTSTVYVFQISLAR
eukprot:jgi/Bigna1/69952/fgenesh1_pg.10_\